MKIVLLIGLSFGLASAIFFANQSLLAPISDFAAIIQGVVVGLGGLFAIFKIMELKYFEPHLTISNRITHRPVGSNLVHIGVVALLHNSSNNRVSVSEGICSIEEVNPAINQTQLRRYDKQPPWQGNWQVFAPKSSRPEVFEFVIPDDIKVVRIDVKFSNPHFTKGFSTNSGWSDTTFYDIV